MSVTGTTAIAERPVLSAATIEQVVIGGDLSKLAPAERVSYYRSVCDSLGLNPLTKPFEYITLNGKLTLYARKDATDQLRSTRTVSVTIAARELVDDIYVVTAQARLANGRTDESIGAVPVKGLSGDAKANAFMKAETKAKRRVTLSICGLGMLDETEAETIPGAFPPSPPAAPAVIRTVSDLKAVEAAEAVNTQTGEVIQLPDSETPIEAVDRLPANCYYVVDVFNGETKTGKKNIKVKLHTNELVTAWTAAHADVAREAYKQSHPVEVQLKETQWGKDIVKIALLPADAERTPF